MDRKDKKGRNLWPGEYQKADGKYEYRYKDAWGKRHSVYSWRLTKSDKTPKGLKHEECLRDLEKQIEEELVKGVCTSTVSLNA